MSVEIKVAGTDDAPGIAALHYLSHTTSFAEFASPEWVSSRRAEDYHRQWREFFHETASVTDATDAVDTRARAWKAVEDSTLVGMVRVSAMSSKEAQLTSMHVHPGWHRRGIGNLLMDAAVSYMRGAAFETAMLGVIQANTAARSLYERGGWRVAELLPDGTEGVPIAIYRLSLRN